jgi:hypothetical protein
MKLNAQLSKNGLWALGLGSEVFSKPDPLTESVVGGIGIGMEQWCGKKPWRKGTPATEETGAMGRGIESHQGIRRVVVFLFKK